MCALAVMVYWMAGLTPLAGSFFMYTALLLLSGLVFGAMFIVLAALCPTLQVAGGLSGARPSLSGLPAISWLSAECSRWALAACMDAGIFHPGRHPCKLWAALTVICLPSLPKT